MDYRCAELQYAPEFWSQKVSAKTLKWMQEIIGTDSEKIVIESHTDFWAEWGELLVERLGAKHICFLLDERLELYGAKEFLYYKYLRSEVAGIHKSSVPRLFRNYKKLKEKEGPVLAASPYIILSEVSNEKIDSLTRMDWNIAYIGRNKQYASNIVNGIIKFASAHGEKEIQFLILGDIGDIMEGYPDNLHIKRLGFITPIPRSFFSYVDVVIAGAGCANIARMAGALTIVADAGTCLSNGLLGYTTDDTLFGGGLQESFDCSTGKCFGKRDMERHALQTEADQIRDRGEPISYGAFQIY